MLDLKDAVTYLEIIVATAAVMLLGDYLGYKIRRWRLAAIIGGVVLVSIIAYAVYSAVVLAA